MTSRTSSLLSPALLPGLGLCAAGAAIAVLVNRALPAASALLVAILLGAVVGNLVPMGERLSPGTSFCAKHLLRAGIILLGCQLALGDVLALGWGMVVVVVGVVCLGILGTLAMGRMLGIAPRQRLLIACGFSICGAAAVAGIDGVVEADSDEVATAIALVVLYGTAMIFGLPAAAHLFGLAPLTAGLWAGASIHEVAQVVAAGAALGPEAMKVAVVVKLARVLMLAPVALVIGALLRRGTAHAEPGTSTSGTSTSGTSTSGTSTSGTSTHRPPLVPGFVLGFLLMVAGASLHLFSPDVLGVAKLLQTALLAAAMFALGLGVNLRRLAHVGAGPFVLGAASTLWVAALGLGGIALLV